MSSWPSKYLERTGLVDTVLLMCFDWHRLIFCENSLCSFGGFSYSVGLTGFLCLHVSPCGALHDFMSWWGLKRLYLLSQFPWQKV